MPTAASLAEAIRSEFGVESTLIEGKGGVFDVHVNNKQVWDKKETERFPEHHEILDQLKEFAPKA